MKTVTQIDEMIDNANEANEDAYSGMSYIEGVKFALEWVLEYCDEAPIDNEE